LISTPQQAIESIERDDEEQNAKPGEVDLEFGLAISSGSGKTKHRASCKLDTHT
jgi:hypothetical protein